MVIKEQAAESVRWVLMVAEVAEALEVTVEQQILGLMDSRC